MAVLVTAGFGIGFWYLPMPALFSGKPEKTGVSLQAAIGQARPDPRHVSFSIDKSAHLLTVMYPGRPVKRYPVVFGSNPTDDKLREGDGCTPEGTYRIRALYPHRRWSRFLWIDYPNARTRARFERAKRTGKVPRGATVGGEIGIHGVPPGEDDLIDRRVNWTLGCVSMKNADIEELYRVSRVGTRVTITR